LLIDALGVEVDAAVQKLHQEFREAWRSVGRSILHRTRARKLPMRFIDHRERLQE